MPADDTTTLLKGGVRKTSIFDPLLPCLTSPVWFYLGGLWLVLVIASGGGYVLPLLGACTLSAASCHTVIEVNIQILTGLFTAINLYTFPGRWNRFYGLFGEHWGTTGVDWRGVHVPSDEERSLLQESYDPASFYHVGWTNRLLITSLLLTSALAQFANQVFHCIYNTYEEAMNWPGNLWDNLFFLISLSTMLIGIIVEAYCDSAVREGKSFPQTATYMILERMIKGLSPGSPEN
jgi:hypothetical protein